MTTRIPAEFLSFLSSRYTAEEVARLPDAVPSMTNRVFQAVGAKVMKFCASAYAFLSHPEADTAKLTKLVSSFISTEGIGPYLSSNGIASVNHMHGLAGYVHSVLGVNRVAPLFLEHFEAASKISCAILDVPTLLSRLMPNVSLHPFTTEQRIQLLEEVLNSKGIQIMPPRAFEDCGNNDDDDSVVVVDVHRHGVHMNSLTFCSANAHSEAVIAEARKFVIATKPSGFHRGATVEDMPDAQRQAYLMSVMHQVRETLRFKEPFGTKLRERGLLPQIFDSHGFVPLQYVTELLVERSNAVDNGLPPPTDEMIHELLLGHDHMQRFQVDTCLHNTDFRDSLCCRALYAHETSRQGDQSLFRSIAEDFSTLTTDALPPRARAWVLVERKMVALMAKRGWRLYDNCQLVFAMDEQHFADFAAYVSQPADKLYDEKINGNAQLFLEIDLNLVASVEGVELRQLPSRNGLPGHYLVSPPRNKEKKPYGMRYFPLVFFTGRTMTLQRPVNASVAPTDCITPGNIDIPTDPMPMPQVRRREAAVTGIAAEAQPAPTTVQDVHVDVPTIRAPRATFDAGPVREQILKFTKDTSRTRLIVTLEKRSTKGDSLYGRVQALKELKEWLTHLGLAYRHVSGNEQFDEFCIAKKVAFSRSIIDELQTELGVALKQPELLEAAITRESANKEWNYERLEFIGDAVLDFLMASDAYLAFEHNVALIGCVTSICCRNAVLCELLPTSLHLHLMAEYGEKLALKCRADIFESLLGALYVDGAGLDAIRGVVCKLFQQLCNKVNDESLSPPHRAQLSDAMHHCPYIGVDRSAIWAANPLNCTAVLHCEPIQQKQLEREELRSCYDSHAAVVGMPRIQDKDYATHFTTGSAYSYRRMLDVSAVNSNIVSLHCAGKPTYVNEIIDERCVPLTFDIDGISLEFVNLDVLIGQWVYSRFKSRSCGIVLDCCGRCAVTGKIKRSYHIHYPQIAVSVRQLGEATDDLKRFVVNRIDLDNNFPFVRRGLVVTTWGPTTVHCGRILLSIPQLLEEADAEGLGYENNDNKWRSSFFFDYMHVTEVARFMALSKAWRRRAMSHILFVVNFRPYFDLIAAANTVFPEVLHERFLRNCVFIRPLAAPGFSHLVPYAEESQYVIAHSSKLFVIGWPDHVEPFVKFHRATISRPKWKDFFENVCRPLLENDVYGGFHWEKVIDKGLVESKKLRMCYCDKFDMVYGPENRPLLPRAFLLPDRKGKITRMRIARETVNDDSSPSGAVVSCTTMLQLTHLRPAVWYDEFGMQHAGRPLASQFHVPEDAHWSQPRDVSLPSFGKIAGTVVGTTWDLFQSALLTVCPWRKAEGKSSVVVRHGARHRSEWRFENGVATFYVGWQPFMRVAGRDMYDALGPKGGMRLLMHFLAPQLRPPLEEFRLLPAGTTRLPLWTDVSKGPGTRRSRSPLMGLVSRSPAVPPRSQPPPPTFTTAPSASSLPSSHRMQIAQRHFSSLFENDYDLQCATDEQRKCHPTDNDEALLRARALYRRSLLRFPEFQPCNDIIFFTSSIEMFAALKSVVANSSSVRFVAPDSPHTPGYDYVSDVAIVAQEIDQWSGNMVLHVASRTSSAGKVAFLMNNDCKKFVGDFPRFADFTHVDNGKEDPTALTRVPRYLPIPPNQMRAESTFLWSAPCPRPPANAILVPCAASATRITPIASSPVKVAAAARSPARIMDANMVQCPTCNIYVVGPVGGPSWTMHTKGRSHTRKLLLEQQQEQQQQQHTATSLSSTAAALSSLLQNWNDNRSQAPSPEQHSTTQQGIPNYVGRVVYANAVHTRCILCAIEVSGPYGGITWLSHEKGKRHMKKMLAFQASGGEANNNTKV